MASKSSCGKLYLKEVTTHFNMLVLKEYIGTTVNSVWLSQHMGTSFKCERLSWLRHDCDHIILLEYWSWFCVLLQHSTWKQHITFSLFHEQDCHWQMYNIRMFTFTWWTPSSSQKSWIDKFPCDWEFLFRWLISDIEESEEHVALLPLVVRDVQTRNFVEVLD